MPLEKLNDKQMLILLNFAANCPHLCFGQPPRGHEADSISYREWKELSRDMNYASSGSSRNWKSGLEWKMYWTELKNKAKSKVTAAKRRSKSCGKTVKPKLTVYEQKIIELAEMAARPVEQRHDASNDSTDTDASEDPVDMDEPNETKENIIESANEVTPEDVSASANGNTQADIDRNNLSEAIQALAATQTAIARSLEAVAASNIAVADALLALRAKDIS